MNFKFNIGDKVKIKKSFLYPRYENGRVILSVPEGIAKYRDRELTIGKIGGHCRYNFPVYCVKEDKDSNCGLGYTWAEDWLEPADKNNIITISFSATTKEEAMENAKKEIEKLFQPEDWTETEITIAQELISVLVGKVVKNGGDVCFTKSGKSILCEVSKDSFCPDSVLTGISTPRGQDVPNDWIGKCVALCSAVHEPIPVFIRNKNR